MDKFNPIQPEYFDSFRTLRPSHHTVDSPFYLVQAVDVTEK